MKNIYAYILMRNDLESMGSGMMCAHGHHAGTQMSYWIRNHGNKLQKKIFHNWENEANGAGTCISLYVTEEVMKIVVQKIRQLSEYGCSSGIWTDPSYPSTLTAYGFHNISVDVCGWAIGPKNLLKPILENLELVPNTVNSDGRPNVQK